MRMEKCTFAWKELDYGKTEADLNDINLSVEPGSLVGIVGFVGSGKSSLLAAILGDMHRISGKVTYTGTIAFAPQLPYVHNMTVRDNILYGKAMDGVFYEKVIRSCQLTNDMNKLQAGDMTEVGEKVRLGLQVTQSLHIRGHPADYITNVIYDSLCDKYC
nr:ATP-binding cassette sub-family C member 2-like [Dermacentor andersoni]